MGTERRCLRVLASRLWLIVPGLLFSASCAAPASPPANSNTLAIPSFEQEYLVGVGDVLTVNVWQSPDLGTTVPVRPDGKITVPLVGDIMVGDHSPESVADEIALKLEAFIKDPRVTVIVSEMARDQYRSRVRVTGAVQQPVSIPYRQGMTVLDVVLDAGGVTEFANLGRASLFRKSGEQIRVDLHGILNRGDLTTNFQLAPGDVVTVPERMF